MDITCVIPCYDSEKYISETIESILSQTTLPIELILVDDKSKDNTLSVIKEIANKRTDMVKVIELSKNKGSSFARNYGVTQAKGEYILFMDSDDIAEPQLIEKYINRLQKLNIKDNNYGLCYSAYVQIDQDGNQTNEVSRGKQFESTEILGYELLRNYIISTSGVLINKQYFNQVGGFNEGIVYSEDWDLWLRLANVTGFAYVDEPLIRLRRHEENMSGNLETMMKAEKEILSQYSLVYIKQAILNRNLSKEKNIIDYVSMLFRLEHWDGGYKELSKLLEDGYDFYQLYFQIGLYYVHLEQIDEAFDYFIKVIEQKENHGAALNNLGALYLLEHNKKEAEKYLKKALDYHPTYMDAQHNYGLLNNDLISMDELKFTWRELREVLTSYSS